jgi:hypothetical protein
MMLLNYIKTMGKSFLLQAFLLAVLGMPAFGINGNDSTLNKATVLSKQIKKKNIRLSEYLQCFYPLQQGAGYSVTICADVPVNGDPACVYQKGEPGHVFLILYNQDPVTGQVITRSFGFYPRVPVTFLIKQVRSRILENCNREYDASIEIKLTADEFGIILEKCKELSKKKYNLKKYNCYEYGLEVFNSLPGIEKLPVTKVKFPFILGRGGSPCGLYKDLKKLMSNGSAWASSIRFGLFKSPVYETSKDLVYSYQ